MIYQLNFNLDALGEPSKQLRSKEETPFKPEHLEKLNADSPAHITYTNED